MNIKTASDTPGRTERSTSPPVDDAVCVFEVGSLVGGYRIERLVATGATGTVYVAKNPTLPRRDALKVLSADLSRDAPFRERFVREADIASLLNHPNIVSIHSRGEADNGQLWIAMQYVEGTDAEAALQAGTMTTPRAMRIVAEVAKALDYAHQRNVVHHDVKPANILLAPGPPNEEQVLLSDFGVARAAGAAEDSDDATLAVTLAYAAPEVIAGGAVDGRADIYSLACTLFRLLTGKQPFSDAEGTTALALAHLRQPPPPISEHLPAASPQLDAVMARALAKNPADRYGSAREFAAAASTAATLAPRRAPTVPPVPGTPPRTPGFRKSFDDPISVAPTLRRRTPAKPVLILWAVFAVVALTAGVLWFKVIAGWSDSPTDASASTSTSTSTSTTAVTSPAALQLDRLLPSGYPVGTCDPAPADGGAAAAVACGPNVDPGGPTSSTYTLSRDLPALRASFTDAMNRSIARICPPNIQSPVLCPTGVSRTFGEVRR